MSKSNLAKSLGDAVRQITERGYLVAEVSQRLGVSQHSLYEWKKKFVWSNAKGNDEADEIRRLKKELARVTEERDILKKAARISRGMQSEQTDLLLKVWEEAARATVIASCTMTFSIRARCAARTGLRLTRIAGRRRLATNAIPASMAAVLPSLLTTRSTGSLT